MCKADVSDISNLLERCCRKKDLVAGRQLHSLLVTNGMCYVALLGDCIIRMFASCGSLLEASLAFCTIAKPSVYTWQAIISAHVHHGHSDKALRLYDKMKSEQVKPNMHVWQCILQACGSIKSSALGMQIHNEIIVSAGELNVVIGSAIIDMYGRCGTLDEAHDVFAKLPGKNIVSWSAMMTACVQHKHGHRVLEIYERMGQDGIKPDDVTFLSVLKACGSIKASLHGRLVHDQIIRTGLESYVVLGSSLVDMYAKCGNLDEARKVFYKLPTRDVVCWGALISGYAQEGHGNIALELYENMQQEGIKPNKAIFPCVLSACSTIGALGQGKLIHCQIIRGGLALDTSIHTALIDMYAKCGCLEESCRVFDRLIDQDVAAWSALIAGYTQHGHDKAVFELFEKMQNKKVTPNSFTWSCMLKLCSNMGALRKGQVIHNQVLKNGFESDVVVGSTLVDMYAKCWCLEEARKVFDSMQTCNVMSWGAMLAGYAQQGHITSAFEFFDLMQLKGLQPNKIMLLCMLTACGSSGTLEHSKLIHDKIIRKGFESDNVIGNALLNMYCKCGSLEKAQRIFDIMPSRDSASWSVMVEGFVQYGHARDALDFFAKMLEKGLKPNKTAVVSSLKACSSTLSHFEGKLVHDQIVSTGLDSDMVIGNALIDMYGKCGDVAEARKVFDQLPDADIVSWSSIIAAYVQVDLGSPALELYEKMQQEGVEPNQVTFLSILKTCRGLRALREGKLVHNQIVSSGFESSDDIGNRIMDMYSKCGNLKDAQKVFDDLLTRDEVSWGVMIAGYAQQGDVACALEFLKEMPIEGLKPKEFIFPSILKACGSIRAVGQGKLMHDWILRSGVELDVAIGSTLIDMYSRCGGLKEAQQVFDELSIHNPILWGAMLAGYTQHGHDLSALRLYKKLQQEGIQPNRGMFMSILKACSSIGALDEGKLVHDHILRCELESDEIISTTLMHMYAKCGSVEEAQSVFDGLTNRDVVCWSAMIACHAQYGDFQMAVQCLKDMDKRGLKPHSTDFTCILFACSQRGKVEEAFQYFTSMRALHGISPRMEHFNRMIMLLCHAGCLEEAEEILKTAPISQDPVGCLSLLSACRIFGNINLGRQFFGQALHDPSIAVGL